METNNPGAIQKMEHSEEIFQAITHHISEGIASIDMSGNFVFVNHKAAQILNGRPSDLTGQNIHSLFGSKNNGTHLAAFQRAITENAFVCFDEYYPAHKRWFEHRLYPSGEGVTLLFFDITARKKKEIIINKAARRDALILATMQNSFLLTDINLNIIDVNPAFCESLGYSRDELLQMKVTDFDVQMQEKEITENLVKTKSMDFLRFETKNKKKSGEIIDVEVVLTEIQLDGEAYFASFGLDISNRKKTEEQIIHEKMLSDAVINSLPGAFYLFDTEGKFIRWNNNFERISQYTSAEIAEMHPLDFFSSEEKVIVKEKIATAFDKGTSEVEAHFYTKHKEKIPYYFTGNLAYFEGRPCLVGMGIDISERKKSEEYLRAMETAILTQKVQEQKKIARAILRAQEQERNYIGCELHDNVNQILAGTKLYLNLAAKKDKVIANLLKYPLELLDNSIDEIRLLSRKTVTPKKNIILRDLLQLLADHINKNTAIKANFTYQVENDIIDDELKLNIYRIVQELVNNILKHAGASTVSISARAVGNTVRIVVADDGRGFQLNKKSEGIGISNILNRVESFNGRIDIDSSPGKGSSTNIEIPYHFE